MGRTKQRMKNSPWDGRGPDDRNFDECRNAAYEWMI